ncbi:PAS domain-containing protein, partial [Streptomyces sp. SID5475]|nr:PAS domain-containing protein [Streptomyces sp. SID5475]
MNFTRWSARLPGTQRRAAVRSDRGGSPQAPSAPGSGVPTAREEPPEPFETPPPAGSPGGRPAARELLARDVLDQVPGLVAVVHGPEHRIAYVNDAYTTVFGDRSLGGPARELLPELTELGLLPLMDQVLRSGKPRTLKARRARGLSRSGHYTFTCTPVELSPADGPEGKPHTDGAATPAATGTVPGPPPDGASSDGASADSTSPDGTAPGSAPGGTASAGGDGH